MFFLAVGMNFPCPYLLAFAPVHSQHESVFVTIAQNRAVCRSMPPSPWSPGPKRSVALGVGSSEMLDDVMELH